MKKAMDIERITKKWVNVHRTAYPNKRKGFIHKGNIQELGMKYSVKKVNGRKVENFLMAENNVLDRNTMIIWHDIRKDYLEKGVVDGETKTGKLLDEFLFNSAKAETEAERKFVEKLNSVEFVEIDEHNFLPCLGSDGDNNVDFFTSAMVKLAMKIELSQDWMDPREFEIAKQEFRSFVRAGIYEADLGPDSNKYAKNWFAMYRGARGIVEKELSSFNNFYELPGFNKVALGNSDLEGHEVIVDASLQEKIRKEGDGQRLFFYAPPITGTNGASFKVRMDKLAPKGVIYVAPSLFKRGFGALDFDGDTLIGTHVLRGNLSDVDQMAENKLFSEWEDDHFEFGEQEFSIYDEEFACEEQAIKQFDRMGKLAKAGFHASKEQVGQITSGTRRLILRNFADIKEALEGGSLTEKEFNEFMYNLIEAKTLKLKHTMHELYESNVYSFEYFLNTFKGLDQFKIFDLFDGSYDFDRLQKTLIGEGDDDNE